MSEQFKSRYIRCRDERRFSLWKFDPFLIALTIIFCLIATIIVGHNSNIDVAEANLDYYTFGRAVMMRACPSEDPYQCTIFERTLEYAKKEKMNDFEHQAFVGLVKESGGDKAGIDAKEFLELVKTPQLSKFDVFRGDKPIVPEFPILLLVWIWYAIIILVFVGIVIFQIQNKEKLVDPVDAHYSWAGNHTWPSRIFAIIVAPWLLVVWLGTSIEEILDHHTFDERRTRMINVEAQRLIDQQHHEEALQRARIDTLEPDLRATYDEIVASHSKLDKLIRDAPNEDAKIKAELKKQLDALQEAIVEVHHQQDERNRSTRLAQLADIAKVVSEATANIRGRLQVSKEITEARRDDAELRSV